MESRAGKGSSFSARSGERLQVEELYSEEWSLRMPEEGLLITLPAPVGAVTVGFVDHGSAELVGFDAEGVEIANETSPGDSFEATVRAPGIAAVLVVAEGGAFLGRVCMPDPIGAGSELLGWEPERREADPPEVVGLHVDGGEERWEPSERGGRECRQVRYEAPSAGPWAGVRVAAAPGRHVTVVSSCGVRWQEAWERHRAERHRIDLLAALTAHASGVVGSGRGVVKGHGPLPLTLLGPPPRPLLAPGKAYRVAVSWEWQAWEAGKGSPGPGPPDPNGWVAGGTDVFGFATAPAAPSTPVDLIGEETFDPRGAARYVTGARPTGPLPHLLDDPIRVTFSVDYLPALLRAYGYEARVEVRPTDVAPGSQYAETHPPNAVDAVELVSWIDDGVLRPVETHVVGEIAASPCVPNTSLGGLAAEVRAGLKPNTAYDLMLVAHPSGGGADRVVSRFHFRTSRYRDVDQLLAELGLGAGTPAGEPPDLLLDGWPGLTERRYEDAGFDAALEALGLDPWPLAAAPRTTTLWVPPDPGRADWGLAGVLLEAPEPIARRDRIAVAGGVGGVPLAHLRSTASGTRVLLAPAAPFAPAAGDALEVRLVDDLRGRTAVGAAQLPGGPGTIRREVG